MTSPSEPWSPSDNPQDEPFTRSAQNWGDSSTLNNRKPQTNWDDTEFEPIDENLSSSSKLEEAKKKREERKLMRQKEMEARRATRTGGGGGPMKLGAKKM